MKKKNWRKLDNVAKIFSLDGKNNTNIFRYSVVLKKNVDKKILVKALMMALDNYEAFRVKLGVGFFWNYLEFNYKEPIVFEENQIPCQHIDFKKNNDYLFKVTYYKKKINLDVFHVLTDGNGALNFFKAIIYNYLDLVNDEVSDKVIKKDISCHEEYLKNYDKGLKLKRHFNFKEVYLLPQKRDKNVNNTYHYVVNMYSIKSVCKSLGVTITEYLTALYIYAMYLSVYDKDSDKEIVISVPINLRKYYQVDTLSNFFVCMNVNPKIVGKRLVTFDYILNQVREEFLVKLNMDSVKKYLARDVKLGNNLLIRLIPLFIKKLFIKYMGPLVSGGATSTLSNVGIVDIDDKYKKYIDNVFVLVVPGRVQKIKCTICSFSNKLNVTVNSNIDDLGFERIFYRLLEEKVGNVSVYSNNLVDLLK